MLAMLLGPMLMYVVWLAASGGRLNPDGVDDAQEISDGSEQAGFGITLGHLVKASAELSPEGTNFRAADDTTMWADAQVRSDGDSMLITDPFID